MVLRTVEVNVSKSAFVGTIDCTNDAANHVLCRVDLPGRF
jgi:hypothetical protein